MGGGLWEEAVHRKSPAGGFSPWSNSAKQNRAMKTLKIDLTEDSGSVSFFKEVLVKPRDPYGLNKTTIEAFTLKGQMCFKWQIVVVKC